MSKPIFLFGLISLLIGFILIYLQIMQWGLIFLLAGIISIIFKDREEEIEQIKNKKYINKKK